ncbi:DUF3106 domain-containing protein [Scleromatobacter humisilvae]|uniref:DUF3106 domain-containing protein n=1 Tax=Scleromatobacter humisilvae TaxID=2897159 RepID=A0A9X1YRE4_9BURK|nr:DUF3106 domain-containing protein [Scleromatobacter humisilvae]MCK9687201.1 DUF3106 domain-containing protein [Scleromatobacter humisilvae]
MSRSRPPRLLESLAAAALAAAACFLASGALAAQAEGAGPSGTAATTAAAKVEPGGPAWADLSPAHRKVLAPLANDWNGLDARSKERWIDVAGRYPKMKPDEQQRANQRMGEWAHMTVAQRTQARMNFQEASSLSKEEREARWKAYQALPEEKKQELAAKRVASRASAASSASVVAAHHHAAAPLDTVQPKNNVIGAPVRTAAGSAPAATGRPVGVTTTLLTRHATPPAHQHDGAPKIAVGPNAVDRTTLLPKHTKVAAAGSAASAPVAVHR